MSLTACDGSSQDAHSDTADAKGPQYDRSLIRGKVVDSITVKGVGQNGTNQQYALYLPGGYDPSKAYPVIFFFDAHARGALPLKKYKDIAEQYGLVMVGSNLSKNGTEWAKTEKGVLDLIDDVKGRIHIDPRRIFTAGFSGGARVAASVALNDGGIAGVIGCAAGFPQFQPPIQNKFHYFGLVGDADFNLPEMEQLDNFLQQSGMHHQLMTFGGKHGWCPVQHFKIAVLWMLATEKTDSVTKYDQSILTELRSQLDTEIKAAVNDAHFIEAHRILEGAAKIIPDGEYQHQIADLEASQAYKEALALHSSVLEAETGIQQEMAKEFTAKDKTCWQHKMTDLNTQANNSKKYEEACMYKRILSYCGLVGYMYADRALQAGDKVHGAIFIEQFKMADPQNPDCAYLKAKWWMQQSNTANAFVSLNEAANLGYDQVQDILTDPEFQAISNSTEFLNIVAKMKHNDQ